MINLTDEDIANMRTDYEHMIAATSTATAEHKASKAKLEANECPRDL